MADDPSSSQPLRRNAEEHLQGQGPTTPPSPQSSSLAAGQHPTTMNRSFPDPHGFASGEQNITAPSNELPHQTNVTPPDSGSVNAHDTISLGLDFDSAGVDPSRITFSEFIALEDNLLPEFSLNPFDILIQEVPLPTDGIRYGQGPLYISHLAGPVQPISPITNPGFAISSSSSLGSDNESRALQEDIDQFEKKMKARKMVELMGNFSLPRRSRLVRFLRAYFEYFDPHTPIVHRSTFSMSENHRKYGTLPGPNY